MKHRLLSVRRALALALTLLCLPSAALATDITGTQSVTIPSQQQMEQALSVRQEEILQGPTASQLTAVRQVAATAAAGQATLSYLPTYNRSLSYNKNAYVPALALQNSTYLGEYKITFYCPCTKCCGAYANGVTASGKTATEGRTIAVDTRKIPMGSKVYIEGLGDFIAEDVGGAVKGNKIDVFVSSHAKAYQIGVISSTSVYLMK